MIFIIKLLVLCVMKNHSRPTARWVTVGVHRPGKLEVSRFLMWSVPLEPASWPAIGPHLAVPGLVLPAGENTGVQPTRPVLWALFPYRLVWSFQGNLLLSLVSLSRFKGKRVALTSLISARFGQTHHPAF